MMRAGFQQHNQSGASETRPRIAPKGVVRQPAPRKHELSIGEILAPASEIGVALPISSRSRRKRYTLIGRFSLILRAASSSRRAMTATRLVERISLVGQNFKATEIKLQNAFSIAVQEHAVKSINKLLSLTVAGCTRVFTQNQLRGQFAIESWLQDFINASAPTTQPLRHKNLFSQ